MSEPRRYVIMPAYGFTAPQLDSGKLRAGPGVLRLDTRSALREVAAPNAEAIAAATTMRVLDEIQADGPKLVEMTAQAELNLRSEIPGLKVIPVVTYRKMLAEQAVKRLVKAAATPAAASTITVSASGGGRLAGAKVIAFTDFRNRTGDQGVTTANGTVSLRIRPGTRLDRLYVYGPPRHWGHYATGVTAGDMTVTLAPIDLDDPNLLLRRSYGAAPLRTGEGAVVAIIDSGVAKKHPALPNVQGGANLVSAETAVDPAAIDEWGPATVEGEHGTHVAGIVGARPAPGLNMTGVAPGVALRSYRVFPSDGSDAINYDIMKAIQRAVSDGCHVINLSLGGGDPDDGVRAAIGAALDAGVLVVAAAGNGYRGAVSFPASLDACVAVSAMGHRSGFPADSTETADVAKPSGTDPDGYIAAFSNFGPQIDLTGPGAGIVSTLPDDAFGVMSGTSMASPAVAGFAARLFAADPAISGSAAATRVALWKAKLLGLGTPQGFGRDYEGSGIPLEGGTV